MSDFQGSPSNFTFGVRRLVLVDSAGFCYVEIPVDNHGLILGPGNLGKSSLLNSLRLFLLPENNFKNSRKNSPSAMPALAASTPTRKATSITFPASSVF